MSADHLHLAAVNDPVDVAWAAFDTAALQLRLLYGPAAAIDDTPAERFARMEKAMEVARLWRAFLDLYVTVNGDDAPKPAA